LTTPVFELIRRIPISQSRRTKARPNGDFTSSLPGATPPLRRFPALFPTGSSPSLKADLTMIGVTRKVIDGKRWARAVGGHFLTGDRDGKVARFPAENYPVLYLYIGTCLISKVVYYRSLNAELASLVLYHSGLLAISLFLFPRSHSKYNRPPCNDSCIPKHLPILESSYT